MESDGLTRKKTKVLLSNQDEIRYPFLESDDNEFLKFPRNQLYRQNSKLAVLVANPERNVTINVTKSHRNMKNQVDENSKPPNFESKNLKQEPLKPKNPYITTESSFPSSGTSINKKNSNVPIVQTSFVAFQSNTTIKTSRSKSESEVINIETIGQNLLEISNDVDFLACDAETLCSILCSDDLDVENESVVFRAALRWLRFRLDDRLVHAQKIMNCVRFGLIKPKDLIKCYIRSRNIGLLDSSEFCENFMIGLLWSTAAYYGLESMVKEIEPKPRNTSGTQQSEVDVQKYNSTSRQSSFSSSKSNF